ncbi:uncharacterized protein LOC123014294 isoform X2 [Tribolium madens]|uniref:uncharacterized protein LOC123014294 isoform X2 n=1 Tax=Tribolium madens TaxID=41895 RepID=UPI001CF75E2D|nr:uncharacterized protein LOC123014294 isoform X2 [Tribolium madens]
MRIAFGVIFITGIFGGFFAENVFALPVAHHHVISKDLDRTAVDEMYKSYISISNDRGDDNDEVISRVQQVYLDSPKISVSKNGKQQKTKQTAYLLVKSMSQRNKRYISCKSHALPLQDLQHGPQTNLPIFPHDKAVGR